MHRRRNASISIFILVVLLALLTSRTAVAASVTVSVPTAEGQNGGTIDVPIQMTGAAGLGALHVELNYDPDVLVAQEVTRGPLAGSNALLESNLKQPGTVVIGIVSLDDIKGDGTIATVRFKLMGDAGAGSALEFQNNRAWERASHAEVLVNARPGKVTIAAGLPSWLIPVAISAVGLLFLLLFLVVMMRRRQLPQPAYAPSGYAPVTSSRSPAPPNLRRTPPPDPPAPVSTVPGRTAPPVDLPERGVPSNAQDTAAPFKHSEDEYFKLKGQLSTNRITPAEFEARARELMVRDARGRYWMLGTETGKWYLHDGAQWVESTPY